MSDTFYFNLEHILLVHDDMVERYGGSHGLRDLSLLESALMRPQTTFGGQDLYETIFDKAAVLMHSLIANHPFVDGNKRTGTACMLIFLEMNEYSLKVSQKSLVKIAVGVATGDIDAQKLSLWIGQYAKKI